MRTLRKGTQGSDVLELQQSLQSIGYNPGKPDGKFGFQTEQAVIQFQKDNGLRADGIAGPATWQKLQSKLALNYQLYTVQPGDTFYKIAAKFKITSTELVNANPGIDPNRLKIGQQIKLPAATTKPRLKRSVAGWIPYWLQTLSFQSVQKHAEFFSSLSPFWYEASATGDINKFSGAEDNTILNFARNHEMSIIPLISNNFSSELTSSILNNPVIRQNHITKLVNLLIQMNYSGIDIDYENLYVKDKEAFVVFLRELKSALTPTGKQLVVSVHAKTNPYGIWSGAEAHDYAGIGKIADLVRIMAYDYHWSGSDPGSIAPVDWVDGVLSYAVSTIPKTKIVLGVPTYGYDWPAGQQGRGISYHYAVSTATKYNVPVISDSNLGPHYSYTVNNIIHEVWYVDNALFTRFVDLINKYDINGIAIWYPGLEDPLIYESIRTKFT